MIIKILPIAIFIVVIAIMGFGCGDDHGDMMSTKDNNNGGVLRVYPLDGVTSVSTSASIAIKFNGKMDTMSVMNNLHILGGGMHEWMDSVSHHGGMGHMSISDMNHMMSWMDSIEIHGTYSWNDALDSCEFTASGGMLANQDHMIFMYEGGMMDHNGGMMGSHHTDSQYLTYHFITGQ